MAIYKNVKVLFCVCLSLNAIDAATDAAAEVSQHFDDTQGYHPRKKARTIDPVKEILTHKTGVLKNELPKAKATLETIKTNLMDKINDLKVTNFRKATELAGLVSSVKVLNSSLENILIHSRKDFTNDDNNLLMVSLAIIGSGALSKQLKSFIKVLQTDEHTTDIDCDVLIDVSTHIDKITNDIPDFIQINK